MFAGSFGQLEVPQVFKQGDDRYCLFCNAGDHWPKTYAASAPGEPVTNTYYLMSKTTSAPGTSRPACLSTGQNLAAAMPATQSRGPRRLPFREFPV